MNENVAYVEPNDLNFNNEDLCIGVKLEVEVTSRAILGDSDNNTLTITAISNDNVNLLEGEDGYLTTSYSDVSFLEIPDGGNKDSVGIENIHIKYSSWFYPEVTIKFIDVRGNSVMNPMENNRDKKGKPSFLNAIFTFPYPEFRLTVKGQYGKPVLYRLAVRDVRSNFNSQTGNFEFNVSFIGYMYGYLTDIPMRYVMLSPYIRYGGTDSYLGVFDETSGEDSGKPIPSFIKFLSQLNQVIVSKDNDTELTRLKNQLNDYISIGDKLSGIKDCIERFVSDFADNLKVQEYFTKTVSGNKNYTFKFKTGEKVFDTTIEDKLSLVVKLLEDVKKYRDEYISLTSGGGYLSISNLSIFGITNFDINNETKTFTFDKTTDIKLVVDALNKVDGIINSHQTEIDNALNHINESALGFKPTIGNIFQIIFAHVDKFYTNVNRCINNIDSNKSQRNLTEIKNCTTDVRGNSNVMTTPPFPLIMNADRKYLWIEESTDPIVLNFDEKDLVKNTIEAAVSCAQEMAEVVQDYEIANKWLGFPEAGIPTLLSDLKTKNTNRVNRYRSKINSYNEDNKNQISDLLRLFAIKVLLRYMLNGGESSCLNAQLFGEIEALNLFHAIKGNLKAVEYIRTNKVWSDYGNMTDKVMDFYAKFLDGVESTEEMRLPIGAEEYDGKFNYNQKLIDVSKQSSSAYGWYLGKEGEKNHLANGVFYTENDINRPLDYTNTINNTTNWISTQTVGKGYSDVFPSYDIPVDYYAAFSNNDNISDIFDSVIDYKNCGLLKNEVKVNIKENPQKFEDYLCSYSRDGFENMLNLDFDDIFGLSPIFRSKTNSVYPLGDKINLSLLGFKYFIDEKYLIQSDSDFFKTIYDDDEKLIYAFFVNIFGWPHHNFNHLFYGVKRIPKITLYTIGYLISSGLIANNESGIYKFALQFYNEHKHGFAEDIRNILIKTAIPENVNIKNYRLPKCVHFKLSEDGKKYLSSLFQETVTVYNLMGTPNFIKKGADLRNIIGTYSGENQDNKTLGENVFQFFVEKLHTLCEEHSATKNKLLDSASVDSSVEKKLSVYMTYKQLYDRWKFGSNDSKLKISRNQFKFIDSKYEDLSHYLVNIDKFANLIRNNLDGLNDMQLYSFMWEVCSMCNFTLNALPVNVYETINSNKKMEEMFTPYNYMTVESQSMDTTYIATYSHRESEHLNITDYNNMYEDDGLDFESNDLVIKSNSRIPVFGVTYGLSTQRYFNNISVGMDAPKVTAHSLMSELQISRQGASSGSQNIGFEGHDIFETYANKSYTCRVEMLGCAQIMPLMYFQLNNISLFKGGYLITDVEHNISNGTMKTSFTGVRMNRNRFNIEDKLIINTSNVKPQNDDSQMGERGISTNEMFGAPNNENVNYSKETTLILIDAGHDMATNGKESKVDYFTNIWDDTSVYTPDLDDEGTMRPLTVSGNEVYNTSNNSGAYREYWGNRKLAMALEERLKELGCKNVEIVSSRGRRAESIYDFSKIINAKWQKADKNCILISLHSNAVDGGDREWKNTNYWSIYCQGKEYVENDKKYVEAPCSNTSYLLASCIGRQAENIIPTQYNGATAIKTTPLIFTKSKNGIRPTTFSKPPTILSENMFHTSKEGVKFLGSKKGRQMLAEVHALGILDFFDEIQKTQKREEMIKNVMNNPDGGYMYNADLPSKDDDKKKGWSLFGL